MECQKIINLLDNTPIQPTKFKTKKWVQINDDGRGTYNTNIKIKFKTSMLRSNLCDYRDAYILVKGAITPAPPPEGNQNNNDKDYFKNWTPFTDCISETNITQIDNAKYIDVIMPMYNLIEYSNNHSKATGNFCQYYRNEPALSDAGTISNFHAANNSASFKFKQEIAIKRADGGTKVVEIMMPLKFLSNVWKTLEMPLVIVKLISF